jgi:hypothetical protein
MPSTRSTQLNMKRMNGKEWPRRHDPLIKFPMRFDLIFLLQIIPRWSFAVDYNGLQLNILQKRAGVEGYTLLASSDVNSKFTAQGFGTILGIKAFEELPFTRILASYNTLVKASAITNSSGIYIVSHYLIWHIKTLQFE